MVRACHATWCIVPLTDHGLLIDHLQCTLPVSAVTKLDASYFGYQLLKRVTNHGLDHLQCIRPVSAVTQLDASYLSYQDLTPVTDHVLPGISSTVHPSRVCRHTTRCIVHWLPFFFHKTDRSRPTSSAVHPVPAVMACCATVDLYLWNTDPAPGNLCWITRSRGSHRVT